MSKFQIVKGIIDNLEETPYTEGKVYFTYDNVESQNIVIYADIDGVRRNISTNVSDLTNDAGYITEETDPTVPAWAKENTKPTYTAAEVGALPDTTVIPEDKVFIATYGTTTYADTLAAYNAGKLIFAKNSNHLTILVSYDSNRFTFSGGRDSAAAVTIWWLDRSTGWSYSNLPYNAITNASSIESGDYIPFVDVNSLNRLSHSASLTFGTETNQYLANNGTWQTIPENTSDLTNDSGFQTSTEVNSAIATAIGNINQFNVAIVSTLPTENIDTHTLYFMSNGGSDDSIYDEWMYINNNWEKIGTTAVDLSGYMQTSHPANGITSTNINNWNAKVEKSQLRVGYVSGDTLYAPGGVSYRVTGESEYTGIFYFVVPSTSASNILGANTTISQVYLINNNRIGITNKTFTESGLYIGYISDNILKAEKIATVNDIPTVPTKVSDLINDSGFISSYTETDPVFSASAAADIKSADISNWNSKTSNTGTVTSIGLTNATDSGLTISGSPITNSGNITVGHSNILSSAQTTQAVYPIKIDKNGHISAYGSAVTITDEKVKQTPLNSKNSIRGLLFSSSPGNSEVTNSVNTSDKIQWNDYDQRLAIYNSDKTKYSYLTDTILSLANNDNSYNGNLQVANLTANRNYSLPDKGGTLALTSDIPKVYSSTNITGYLTMDTLPIYDGTVA